MRKEGSTIIAFANQSGALLLILVFGVWESLQGCKGATEQWVTESETAHNSLQTTASSGEGWVFNDKTVLSLLSADIKHTLVFDATNIRLPAESLPPVFCPVVVTP